jgi:hypothetical protein
VIGEERDVRRQIATALDGLRLDRDGSKTLFEYVWTIMCIRRGLLIIVDEDRDYVLVEEQSTGRRRRVARPVALDAQTEGLAVEALSHLIEVSRSPR